MRLRPLAAAVAAVSGVLLVYILVFPNLWYGFFDVSDIPLYRDYALRMHRGFRPYIDFPFEYPPLAIPLFAWPETPQDLDAYGTSFARLMLAFIAVTSAVVGLTASFLDAPGRSQYRACVAFGVGVACAGAIVANRYDAAVACVLALCLAFLAQRMWTAAALALGVGFSLKLTPAILLPLVLMLASTRRQLVACLAAFAISAVLPWLPMLVQGTAVLTSVFGYHAQRPLQVESVLASPYWVGHLLHGVDVRIVNAFGSQVIEARGFGSGARVLGLVLVGAALAMGPVVMRQRDRRQNMDQRAFVVGRWAIRGAGALGLWFFVSAADSAEVAQFTFPLTIVAMSIVYGFVWRCRHALRRTPRHVPLACLAVILTFVVCSKVLSPQFLIWLLPPMALVAVERPWLSVVCAVAMLCTQIVFPRHYWDFIALDPQAISWVVFRNLTLVAAFLMSLVTLTRLARSTENDSDSSAVQHNDHVAVG